jgi:hypothetical protein
MGSAVETRSFIVGISGPQLVLRRRIPVEPLNAEEGRSLDATPNFAPVRESSDLS